MLAVCSPPAPGSGWSRTRAHEPPCDTQCSLTPTPHALHAYACLDVQATQSNHPSTSPPMVSCPYRPPSRATCRRAVHQGLHDEQGPAGLQDQHENWGEYTALPYPAPHRPALPTSPYITPHRPALPTSPYITPHHPHYPASPTLPDTCILYDPAPLLPAAWG